MRLELPVIRVQVQRDRIKPGLAPHREYRPGVLHEVAELHVTPDGAIGVDADGKRHIDVHHRQHPNTRDARGRSGLSIMTTGDYLALRARYGPHLVDGLAGESILLDYAPGLARRAMPAELWITPCGTPGGTVVAAASMTANGTAARRPDGPRWSERAVAGNIVILEKHGAAGEVAASLHLTGVHVAKPCVEFARFCLRQKPSPTADDAVRRGLIDLDEGARGYKMIAAGDGVIRPGDVLICDLAD
ncbi:MAG: hypothetical protein BGO26_20070 [Actinobacteria bacterium 69-20]|jgi:hypothetical protein|nr:hypothetical protein [Actinomycetota bacterium]OJV24814.1 MAG: hypothetical protein BGO26_20070 [Actinobacteria bacterium 69-20]